MDTLDSEMVASDRKIKVVELKVWGGQFFGLGGPQAVKTR